MKRKRKRQRARGRGAGGVELRVVVQDAALELTKPGPRLEAELVAQTVANVGVVIEGIRLPAGAIERDHCKLMGSLAVDVLFCVSDCLTEHFGRSTECEQRVEPLIDRNES